MTRQGNDNSGNGRNGAVRRLRDRFARSRIWTLFSDRGPDRARSRFTGSGEDQAPPVFDVNSSGHSR